MRYLPIALAAALPMLLSACGGPLTQATARLVDQTCQQFNANPLVAMPSRMQAVGAINAFTTSGNYTPADCDNDGEPDFAIDANGRPLPPTP